MSMRKILLFAAFAIVASSVNAQLQDKRSSFRKAHAEKVVVPASSVKSSKKQMVMPSTTSGKLSVNLFAPDVKLAKTAKGVEALQAGRATFMAAPLKAASVLATYDAYGKDLDGESYTWTMTSGTTDGKLILSNVIPGSKEYNLDKVPVEYTISGSTLTILPQYVGQVTGEDKAGEKFTDYIYICSGDAEAITLTLNEDGSLSTEDDILYAGFTENAFDATLQTYDGYFEYYTKISYLVPGQAKAPTVFYEPDGIYLHESFSPSWYGYNASLMYLPAEAETAFLNYTQDNVDSWSWSMNKLKVNAAGTAYEVDEEYTGSKASFSVVTEAGRVYSPATLVGSFKGATSEPYQWSVRRNKTEGYVYGGGMMGTSAFTDGTYPQVTKCDPANRVTSAAYMGTPSVNSQSYSLSSLIFYQGKPAAPLYFEGVTLWVGGFTKADDFNLKCKIVKVSRDPETLGLTLGDVVAEADVDLDDIYLDSEDASDVWALLSWNSFYTTDEFGLSEEIDYLQLDGEFAIVFDGWDNGTFTAYPIVEYSGDMVNSASTTSLYLTQTGDAKVYAFFQNYSHPYVGYKTAIYGWLHTDDSKNIVLPAEGGQASIHVDPYLYSTDEAENAKTALWLAEGCEMPEWLEVSYTDPADTQNTEFDLVFSAAALPEGVAGRSASLTFEQWGAKLEVTVSQGATEGVQTVVTSKVANSKTYDLSGRQVNGKKGLVVRDGKKFIVK